MKYLIFKGLIGKDIGLTTFDMVLYSTLSMKSIQDDYSLHDTNGESMNSEEIEEFLDTDNGYIPMLKINNDFLVRTFCRKERTIFYSFKKLRDLGIIRKNGRGFDIKLKYELYADGYLEVENIDGLSLNASVLYSMLKDKFSNFNGNLFERRSTLSKDFYGDDKHEEAFKKLIHELRNKELISREKKQLKVI